MMIHHVRLRRLTGPAGVWVLAVICTLALLAETHASELAHSERADVLNELANRLEMRGALELHASVLESKVIWTANFHDQVNLPSRVSDASPGARRAPGPLWCEVLNEQLVQLTEEVWERSGGDFDADEDMVTEFNSGIVNNRVFREAYRMHGRSWAWERGEEPPFSAPSGQVENPEELRLTAIIRPTKLTWRRREAISGWICWKNTGKQPIHLTVADMPGVRITRLDGTSPPWLPPKFFICGGVVSHSAVTLDPGMYVDSWFDVATDPLSMRDALPLDDGHYVLNLPRDELNSPTDCRPVEIEVSTAPGQNLSPRIIFFGLGGRTLATVRENGDYASHDIDTGAYLGGGQMEAYSPVCTFTREFAVSPDGQWLALIRDPYSGPIATDIELYDLHKRNTEPRRIALAPLDGYRTSRIVGFTPIGTLLFHADHAIWEVDSASGSVISASDSKLEDFWKNNGYRIAATRTGLYFFHRSTRDAAVKLPPYEPEFAELIWADEQGIFLRHRPGNQCTFHSYDGGHTAVVSQQWDEFVNESPEERIVALRSRHPGLYGEQNPVEFWHLDPPRKLWSLPRQVVFTSPPVLVVCATRDQGGVFGVNNYKPTYDIYAATTGSLLRTISTSEQAEP
jgi:hypothetical protein